MIKIMLEMIVDKHLKMQDEMYFICFEQKKMHIKIFLTEIIFIM